MNNEPVAWMVRKDTDEVYLAKKWAYEYAEYIKAEVIPLYTHPVKEHFEDEPQAEELHEIMQSNTHLVKEQDESFDRTASHMAGEYVSWTSCVACGQRVTGDSIHTCSPQLKEQDTDCQYCKQGCIRCDARKQLTDEEMKDLIQEYWGDVHIVDPDGYLHEIAFIRAILRKAQEK